jgi:Domain of unknown function (DUF4494)
MEQYYKATVKVQFEDKKGNVKFKREAYIVSAISPTEVEAKVAKELSTGDYEIVGINVTNIVDVIK